MDDKVRVLAVVSGLAIGEPMGGAERFGIELACSLDRAIFEPSVCAVWRRHVPSEAFWAQRLADAGVPLLELADWPGRADPRAYASAFAALARHLHGADIDIIHCHRPLPSLAALPLKHLYGVKALVRTAHAGKEWGDGPAAFMFRQVFTQWLLPLTLDAEACVSQAQVDAFNRRPGARLCRRSARLLHNAIELDRFTRAPDPALIAALRSEFGLAPADRVVGSVGRLRKEKAYPDLVAAAALVRAAEPNARFLLVGDGPQREALVGQARSLGLADAFIFAGARTDPELFYHLMDVFVLSSVWEGLPTVILESMASGVPVVATDIPGSRELIAPGRTGWLVPPSDPARLADGILAALRAPDECVRISRAALEEVVPHFSLARVAKEYERLYLELLGNPS
jgi:glycosyltransferase involved in cell wall biosynthesis